MNAIWHESESEALERVVETGPGERLAALTAQNTALKEELHRAKQLLWGVVYAAPDHLLWVDMQTLYAFHPAEATLACVQDPTAYRIAVKAGLTRRP